MKKHSKCSVILLWLVTICLLLASCNTQVPELEENVSCLESESESLRQDRESDPLPTSAHTETENEVTEIIDTPSEDPSAETETEAKTEVETETDSTHSFETDPGRETVSEVVPTPTPETETASTDLSQDIPQRSYGDDFYLLIQEDSNRFEYHWAAEPGSSQLSSAVYARTESILGHLGVTVHGIKAGSSGTYTEAFKASIQSKDGHYHALLTHACAGVPALVQNGYLKDLYRAPDLRLEEDYWSHDVMNSIAFDDRAYLGHSDLNILYTHVITFNKTMLAESTSLNTEALYGMVDDMQWTLDRMIGLASEVSTDHTKDGKTADDIYGLTGVQWVPFIGLMQASDIRIVEPCETGEYRLAAGTERVYNKTEILVDKLKALAASDIAWFKYRLEATPEIPLTSGRALMSLQSTYSLSGLSSYDISFGILPYPMFDEAQKDVGYLHLQWGGYIALPAYLSDPQMVCETVDLLAFYSQDVKQAYLATMLGKDPAAAPREAEMLTLVWDTLCSDFALPYAEVCDPTLYMLPELTNPAGNIELSSYCAIREKAVNKSIKKFTNAVEKYAP